MLLGSSNNKMRLLLSSALARQKSCPWPSEKKFSFMATSRGRSPESAVGWALAEMTSHKPTALRALIILSSQLTENGSAFCRKLLLKTKGACVRQLSFLRRTEGGRLAMSCPSMKMFPASTCTMRSSDMNKELLPLLDVTVSISNGVETCSWGRDLLTCRSCHISQLSVQARWSS